MNVLDPEAGLKLVNAGGKLLVAAEELVEKFFRLHGQAALVGQVKHVHEFPVIGSSHGLEHRARGRFS